MYTTIFFLSYFLKFCWHWNVYTRSHMHATSYAKNSWPCSVRRPASKNARRWNGSTCTNQHTALKRQLRIVRVDLDTDETHIAPQGQAEAEKFVRNLKIHSMKMQETKDDRTLTWPLAKKPPGIQGLPLYKTVGLEDAPAVTSHNQPWCRHQSCSYSRIAKKPAAVVIGRHVKCVCP